LGALEIPGVVVKNLGLSDYRDVWKAMQSFTQTRDFNTPDEVWIVEHFPVYTLGRNGKHEHILHNTEIPIIKVDRGGQVTYHGPGQLVIYLLFDLHRRNLGIRRLVTLIEDCIINLLLEYKIKANNDPKAPGVYVEGKKIAALGLRVSKGRTTHGLSLNVDMDLSPFNHINPCGYAGLEVTQCKNLGIKDNIAQLGDRLQKMITNELTLIVN
jgi:lipoyl(octanoyl) transferase